MALANQEAQRLQHSHIGTEHELLGLVKDGSGVGANVLRNLNIDLRQLRLRVEELAPSGTAADIGKLPQTPQAKAVIMEAINAARELGHNYVGTEHMLLGMIREPAGIAGTVLRQAGATLERVQAEVVSVLAAGSTAEQVPNLAPETSLDIPALLEELRIRRLEFQTVGRRKAEPMQTVIIGWLVVLTVIVLALAVLMGRALMSSTR